MKFRKPILFLLALIPFLMLVAGFFTDRLGANPVAKITHQTGIWTLRFLVITLAITPLRTLTKWNELVRYRRMIGLFAFFYGFCHYLTYLWLDQSFDWQEIPKDIAKRPFITLGVTSFFLMAPLAVTSTNGWVKRLGGKKWQALHRLVYFSAIAGVAHFYWLVKADTREPIIYGTIVAILLGFRLWKTWVKK